MAPLSSPYLPLGNGDEPLADTEIAGHQATLDDFYRLDGLTPETIQYIALPLFAEFGQSIVAGPTTLRERPQERPLAPAPAKFKSEATPPVPEEAKSVLQPGASGRTIQKNVDLACERCREVFERTPPATLGRADLGAF